MIRHRKQIAHWFVPIIFIMLITACKDTSTATRTLGPGEPPAPAVSAEVDSAPVTTPEVETVTVPEPSGKEQATVNPNDKVSLASVEHPATDEDEAGQDSKPVQPVKPKMDSQDVYSQAKPSLLGLTLKTPAEVVEGKFGKPKEQFVMDDDSDPITVYDYVDFMVGFNKHNLLQFIDIRNGEINPGLNGLKLGQSTKDVFAALGKPDSNTSFVLTYKSPGAVLKLDIDPKTENVNSIKLFAVD